MKFALFITILAYCLGLSMGFLHQAINRGVIGVKPSGMNQELKLLYSGRNYSEFSY
jgi:hypothetical protein